MKEIKAILKHWKTMDASASRAVLATVVRVAGSSYRREGARMLIAEDGQWTGGISGGCLEGDALRKAQQTLFQQQARVVTYNTLDDDPFQIGASLGCRGLISVLLEPLENSQVWNPLSLLERAVKANTPSVLFIVLSGPQPEGTKALFIQGEGLIGAELPIEPAELEALAREVLNSGQSQHKDFQGGLVVLAELLLPPLHLMIFGNNYDVLPLLELAAVLDWQVSVTGKVSAFDRRAFDLARISPSMPPIPNPSRTAAVLMAHDFKTDKANLLKLLDTEVPFIGLLGPKNRTERMLGEIESEHRTLSAHERQRIFGPVGLDIGANTPETIALSILAEIQAFFGKRPGGHLRLKEGPIYG